MWQHEENGDPDESNLRTVVGNIYSGSKWEEMECLTTQISYEGVIVKWNLRL